MIWFRKATKSYALSCAVAIFPCLTHDRSISGKKEVHRKVEMAFSGKKNNINYSELLSGMRRSGKRQDKNL